MSNFAGHDHHESLPGYSSQQLLHDGCGECERRSKEPGLGIPHLDPINFAWAWTRANEWKRDGLPDVAEVEKPMLNALWAVQVQLEQRGVPMGQCPRVALTIADFSGLVDEHLRNVAKNITEEFAGSRLDKVIIDDVPHTETFDDMGDVTVTHFAVTGMPQEDLPEALRGMVPIEDLDLYKDPDVRARWMRDFGVCQRGGSAHFRDHMKLSSCVDWTSLDTPACKFCGMPLGTDGFCTETHPPELSGPR